MDLRERAEHIYHAERDLEYRKDFLALCRQDCVFACNTLAWTFDPRNEGENRHIPFLLYEQQEEFIRFMLACMTEGRDGLVEKSRDTGASWCALWVIFWCWYFQNAFSALLGSRKEDFVDKAEDPSCLMWKLDFLYENLPTWMAIPGYTGTKPNRTHMMMSNPANGSVITGESANTNFGRAGRYAIALKDEAAFWPNLGASFNSSSQSTKCRFLVSTPNGMNKFGLLANPKQKKGEKKKGIAKIRLHWSLDPRHMVEIKDTDPDSPTFGQMINPWLEEQRERYNHDPELMAQELDIDYRSSVKGRYYPQIDFSVLGIYPYDPTLPLYSAWDFGIGDSTAIVWVQWHAPTLRYRAVDCYQNKGKSIAWFVPFITGLAPGDPNGETYTPSDLEVIGRHRGWRHTAHFGDPSGNNKSQTSGTSVIQELAKEKIYITCNYKENTHAKRRHATQRVLLHMDIDEEMCADFVDAIRNSKFPEKPEGHQDTSTNSKPVHDEYSHYRTALEYFAVNDPHRYDTENRKERHNRHGQTVGAVFGNRSLLEKIMQQQNELFDDFDPDEDDYDFGDKDPYAGLSVAGY